ncbi:MAG: single-stranded-DNA-specific exonuclease RecJ [Ruminococcus sp.]|nr:single-stranded-DNA-specific exonuclease RecJ [Ruminococcus sp.]
MRRWIINKPDEKAVMNIVNNTDLSMLCAEIMSSRGVNDIETLGEFFNGGELSDPFEIKDMDKAVKAINKAIESFELICVYGDYDCDGVTSTVVLYNYLESMGANVMYYIPERDDGYGLNREAVKMLSEQGVSLIVTVDNGVSAIDEAEYIYELGMKLVVTDHHQPPATLPRAEAVVDPHRIDCPSQFKNLAGVGVALKLCAALDDGNYDMVLEQYADLVAIGTVADIVKLDGENRIIVSAGLELIRNSENTGLNYILDKCGISRDSINSTSIAFGIAPRINAAGRFGSPICAVKALLEEGEDSEVQVERMFELNNQRKETENQILESIIAYINENPQELNQRVLVICGKGWHHGVVGIVSARLVELFGKPNVILSVDEKGEVRGSARSIPGFHIHKCFTYCEDLLIKYGGHECAGGLSLEEKNIPEFCRRVQQYAAMNNPSMPPLSISADKVLRGRDMNVRAIESLDLLEPFGEGNPRPVFAILGARLSKIMPLSKGKHSRLELEYDGVRFSALLFGTSPEDVMVRTGENCDMLVTAEINNYNNQKTVSVKIVDYRLSGTKQEPYFAAKNCYESFMLGEKIPDSFVSKIVPSREELVSLYKILSRYVNTTYDNLFMRVGNTMNYCKMRLCIDIFDEIGLVLNNPVSKTVSVEKVTERKDINDSELFIRLQNMQK